eukprot:PhF_6_TR33372/c0_g1_i1/m.48768
MAEYSKCLKFKPHRKTGLCTSCNFPAQHHVKDLTRFLTNKPFDPWKEDRALNTEEDEKTFLNFIQSIQPSLIRQRGPEISDELIPLFRTLVELAKRSIPASTIGASFYSLLEGQSPKVSNWLLILAMCVTQQGNNRDDEMTDLYNIFATTWLETFSPQIGDNTFSMQAFQDLLG